MGFVVFNIFSVVYLIVVNEAASRIIFDIDYCIRILIVRFFRNYANNFGLSLSSTSYISVKSMLILPLRFWWILPFCGDPLGSTIFFIRSLLRNLDSPKTPNNDFVIDLFPGRNPSLSINWGFITSSSCQSNTSLFVMATKYLTSSKGCGYFFALEFW